MDSKHLVCPASTAREDGTRAPGPPGLRPGLVRIRRVRGRRVRRRGCRAPRRRPRQRASLGGGSVFERPWRRSIGRRCDQGGAQVSDGGGGRGGARDPLRRRRRRPQRSIHDGGAGRYDRRRRIHRRGRRIQRSCAHSWRHPSQSPASGHRHQRRTDRPRARAPPRGAGARARRAGVLHRGALRPPLRPPQAVGPRRPRRQGLVQRRPRAGVHRVHLLPLLPAENRRRQDHVPVRAVEEDPAGGTRTRRVVRMVPGDAHGREHRRGARGRRVAVPRVPRHLQLLGRELPASQARSLSHAAAHARGARTRVAERGALPDHHAHRHRERGRAADTGPTAGAEGAVQAAATSARPGRSRRRRRRR